MSWQDRTGRPLGRKRHNESVQMSAKPRHPPATQNLQGPIKKRVATTVAPERQRRVIPRHRKSAPFQDTHGKSGKRMGKRRSKVASKGEKCLEGGLDTRSDTRSDAATMPLRYRYDAKNSQKTPKKSNPHTLPKPRRTRYDTRLSTGSTLPVRWSLRGCHR